MSRNVTLINNAYPITYFVDNNFSQVGPNNPNQFWASEEKYAPEVDYLIYDFGTSRPVNFLDLEIAYKPVDIEVLYDDGTGTFVPCVPKDEFQTTLSIQYLPAIENPWAYIEFHFSLVETRYIKLVLTRREDPFPLRDSDPIAYSIDIRSLRLMHIISSADDFVPDTGQDVLGNSYRTDLDVYYADAVDDDDTSTFWQSQPNPSPTAVEALYFDMRGGFIVPRMDYLDTNVNDDLDGRSMAEMELFYQDGVVVDEIYIDPITVGPSMHMYYSLDDYSDYENKLWIPINRHYVLQRGYHSLPTSTYVKYLKLEFTNLTPAPYNIPEYPDLPPVIYRKYPTWVQNYFKNFYNTNSNSDSLIDLVDTVEINPLSFGFTRETDLLSVGFVLRNPPTPDLTNTEVQDFITGLVTVQKIPSEPQVALESQIEFNSSFMWQNNLIEQLDLTRALSRRARVGEDSWTAELTPLTLPPPSVQSTEDLSVAKNEKLAPRLWFPIRCRHAYQLLKATRPSKIAYFVALREVKIHRRDYSVQFDEKFYVETMGDTDHTEVNDFLQEDWRYVVG